MKILFVSANSDPRISPINGEGQRTRLLYDACTRIADVDVISFAGTNEKMTPQGKFQKWRAVLPFSGVSSLFPVNKEREAIIDAAVKSHRYDYIVARYFYRAIPCGLWKYRDKLLVDFDDALSFFFLSQIIPSSPWTTRLRLQLAARKANAISKQAVKELHAAFFAEKETALDNKAIYLPNIPFYGETCSDADMYNGHPRILFVGQLEYQPNKEGLNEFLEQVYLPLSRRLPSVEMHIVGLVRDKSLRQRWESYPNVTVTGFVDDLRQEYADSQVIVVPIRRCGATNIKLLEAMAMNRACVASREAYSPFADEFVDKRDLYVADNAATFVEAVYTLLTDAPENKRVAQNAKIAIGARYSFASFAGIVKSAIQ